MDNYSGSLEVFMDNYSGSIEINNVNGVRNEVVVYIEEMLDELKPPHDPSSPPLSPALSQRCIYRVPMEVREVNKKAYTPRIVSIGPFHHNNEILKSMEEVKQRYMKKFVRRSGNSILDNCFDFVKNREARIRDCYSERIEMDSNEFIKMVLVDSCFIIQFFISFNTNWVDDDDRSLSLDHKTFDNIILDLILLENQVPFFVLEGLFSLATFEALSLLDLALYFLSTPTNLHLFEGFKIINSSELHIQTVMHFTHLVLIIYQPQPQGQLPQPNERCRVLHSATKLTDAGVRFREKRLRKGWFDITFTNKVLEIPSFLLHDDTEILIRNLMALVLCHDPKESFVTDYFIFMDCLIGTTRDVNLLVDKKIIINNLGNNKVAVDFFDKLYINVQYDPGNFYFSQVCKELNDYYKFPMLKLMRRYYIYTLKRDYCNNLWKTAATIGAIMLLVLTIIQTVCSIISVKDK